MQRLFVLILLSLPILSLAQRAPRESIQFEKPPVIDGKVDDWTGEWWLDPDGRFLSNVGNDADNLYFRLKISDDRVQQKVALFGLSLKLNPKGKKRGKIGLKYPVGKDPSELKKEPPQMLDPAMEISAKVAMKKEWISDVEVVELIGLAKQNIVSSRLGLANGIESIIVAQDDGSYIYEAKIPFKAFNINKNEVALLGVEFETGKLIVENKATSANPGMSSSPRYRGPGSMGQQPRYYSSYQYNPLTTPAYMSTAVKLK
jgi:hypothetical protein